MEMIFFAINALTIIALLMSIIYTAGVVWRVEKKLDVSYKFFLAAVVFLFGAEVLDLYPAVESQLKADLIVKSLRMFSAASFLGGILFMRDIVCDLDGERKKNKK